MNRIVAVTGCFDVLHRGHLELFRFAKGLGDYLLVGLNSGESIRRLKGPTRPINSEADRLAMVSAIRWVDEAVIFQGDTIEQFLWNYWPHVWVKGGDYTMKTLHKGEVWVARAIKAEIVLFPTVSGYSTTKLLEQMGGKC